jgi:hypothetical protein
MIIRREQHDYQGIAYRDGTTRSLAQGVMALFALSVFGHYAVIIYLTKNGDAATVETLQSIFHEWLPVLSSVLGAVVSYYFAERKK